MAGLSVLSNQPPLVASGLAPAPPSAAPPQPTGPTQPPSELSELQDMIDTQKRMTGDLKGIDAELAPLQASRLSELRNYAPDPSEKWLKFAETIAAPTKYGTLGEVVSNVAGGLGPIIGREAALKNQYRMLAEQEGYQAKQRQRDQLQSAITANAGHLLRAETQRQRYSNTGDRALDGKLDQVTMLATAEARRVGANQEQTQAMIDEAKRQILINHGKVPTESNPATEFGGTMSKEAMIAQLRANPAPWMTQADIDSAVADIQKAGPERKRTNAEILAEAPSRADAAKTIAQSRASGALAAQLPKEDVVDLTAQWKAPPPGDGRNSNTPQARAAVAAILARHPDYDLPGHRSAWEAVKKYTDPNSKPRQEINSFSTAISHLNSYNEAMDALDNGNLLVANRIANKWASETGQPAPAGAAAIRSFLAGELVRSATGVGGALEDRKEEIKNLAEEQSPAQRSASTTNLIKLLSGKLATHEGSYRNIAKRDDFRDLIIPTDDARAAYESFSPASKLLPIKGGPSSYGAKKAVGRVVNGVIRNPDGTFSEAN